MLSQNERKFDEILKNNLKKHREPIRDDFARELLANIQTAEQQNALRKVVLQESIFLAAFILLPLSALSTLFIFPSLIAGVGQFLTGLFPLINQAFESLIKQWQLLAYDAMAILACLYTAYEMLRPESQ